MRGLDDDRRQVLADAAERFGADRRRVLLPEGGVGDPRPVSRVGAERSTSSRSTPACCSRRPTTRGRAFEERYGIDDRRRARRAARARCGRPTPTAAARCARSCRCATASTGSTPGSPASAASSRRRARRHARRRLGRQARPVQGHAARGLDRAGRVDAHQRARPAVPRAARPGLRLDRLRRPAPCPATAATGAGPAPTSSSAACTRRSRRPLAFHRDGPARHRLRPRRRHPRRPDRHRRRLADDAAAAPRSAATARSSRSAPTSPTARSRRPSAAGATCAQGTSTCACRGGWPPARSPARCSASSRSTA